MESTSIKRTRPAGHPHVLVVTIDRPPVNAMTLAAHRESNPQLRRSTPLLRAHAAFAPNVQQTE